MKNIFQVNTNNSYSLRLNLFCRNLKTVKYGSETISCLTPKMWSLVPEIIKISKTLNIFKNKIRKWKLDSPCRLCKTYMQHVGFI